MISTLISTRVYAFGSNGAGQLGVNHYDDLNKPQICHFRISDATRRLEDRPCPTATRLMDRVKVVVAGGNHTLLLTEKGILYASGNNEDGRCTLPPDHPSLSAFTYVPWAQSLNITHLASTWETSFFVQDARVVWVSGSGNKGELGLGRDVLLASSPRVAFDVREKEHAGCEIVNISGSMSHVVVLLSNGHVYGWGSCRKGQLGDDNKDEKILWQPQKLQVPGRVDEIAVGRDFTVLKCPDLDLVMLGDLKSNDEHQRLKIPEPPSKFVAGWTTLYRLTDDRVRGFGLGRRGQLPPPDLPPLTSFSAGSEHCVALTARRELIAWGWGEHGNCGTPLDDRSCVAERFNPIPISESKNDDIAGIAAGCATSFAWLSAEVDEKAMSEQ